MVFGGTVSQDLIANRLVRCMVETIFRNRARRRLAGLDHEPIYRSQVRTLVGMVHQSRHSRFGRDHDFCRIHTIRDFQRLVPLRSFSQLFQEYWETSILNRDNTTWPHFPFAALVKRLTGRIQEVPLSPALLATHGKAALTALGLVGKIKSRSPLFSGQIVVLGKDWGLQKRGEVTLGSLESLAISQLPVFLKPSIKGPVDLKSDNGSPPEKIIADLLQSPVTCIAGTASRILRFLTQVKNTIRRGTLEEVWPSLAAVIYTRGFSRVDRGQLVNSLGKSGVLVLEALIHPEGPIALEDPRYGCLRLLPDHGVFFEFVPWEDLGHSNPRRHSVGEIELGVPYGIALTSSGIWACLVPGKIRFERRDPPLFHALEQPAKVEPARPTTPAYPIPAQPFPADVELVPEAYAESNERSFFSMMPI